MVPSDLDELILSFCSERLQKVARIAAKTYEVLEDRAIEITAATADAFDECMAALVGSGKLEAQGNIKRWCYSEVRLAGGKKAANDFSRAPTGGRKLETAE
jgi:hypothetical protein